MTDKDFMILWHEPEIKSGFVTETKITNILQISDLFLFPISTVFNHRSFRLDCSIWVHFYLTLYVISYASSQRKTHIVRPPLRRPNASSYWITLCVFPMKFTIRLPMYFFMRPLMSMRLPIEIPNASANKKTLCVLSLYCACVFSCNFKYVLPLLCVFSAIF